MKEKISIGFTTNDMINSVNNDSVKNFLGKKIILKGFCITKEHEQLLSLLKTEEGYLGSASQSVSKSLLALHEQFNEDEITNGIELTICSGVKGGLYLQYGSV